MNFILIKVHLLIDLFYVDQDIEDLVGNVVSKDAADNHIESIVINTVDLDITSGPEPEPGTTGARGDFPPTTPLSSPPATPSDLASSQCDTLDPHVAVTSVTKQKLSETWRSGHITNLDPQHMTATQIQGSDDAVALNHGFTPVRLQHLDSMLCRSQLSPRHFNSGFDRMAASDSSSGSVGDPVSGENIGQSGLDLRGVDGPGDGLTSGSESSDWIGTGQTTGDISVVDVPRSLCGPDPFSVGISDTVAETLASPTLDSSPLSNSNLIALEEFYKGENFQFSDESALILEQTNVNILPGNLTDNSEENNSADEGNSIDMADRIRPHESLLDGCGSSGTGDSEQNSPSYLAMNVQTGQSPNLPQPDGLASVCLQGVIGGEGAENLNNRENIGSVRWSVNDHGQQPNASRPRFELTNSFTDINAVRTRHSTRSLSQQAPEFQSPPAKRSREAFPTRIGRRRRKSKRDKETAYKPPDTSDESTTSECNSDNSSRESWKRSSGSEHVSRRQARRKRHKPNVPMPAMRLDRLQSAKPALQSPDCSVLTGGNPTYASAFLQNEVFTQRGALSDTKLRAIKQNSIDRTLNTPFVIRHVKLNRKDLAIMMDARRAIPVQGVKAYISLLNLRDELQISSQRKVKFLLVDPNASFTFLQADEGVAPKREKLLLKFMKNHSTPDSDTTHIFFPSTDM